MNRAVMSNITTTVLMLAIIALQIAVCSAGFAIQQLQESVRLSSQRVIALERELRASNDPTVHYRALAEAESGRE